MSRNGVNIEVTNIKKNPEEGEVKEVSINGKSYYLERKKNGECVLFSRRCPHMGGEVRCESDVFRCPLHGWVFERETGESTNVEGEKLSTYPVWEEGREIFAEVPVDSKAKSETYGAEENIKVNLHSHACMEIECGGFSLLTDPWLEGNAFMGAWELFPPPVTEAENMSPDAIWISHEHSDHFHIESLKNFRRDIPIYFPDFPNQRIPKTLEDEGFENVNPMPFGKPFGIEESVKITCFEPKSMWNDSMVLIECGDKRIFNLNDAGINDNVADTIGEVDIVASAYTWGASGYPLTWTHLDDEEKEEVIRESNEGMLDMLRQAADLYGAEYVLPFAAHWVLWHPDHREYLEKMEKNRLKDVVEAFKGSPVEVIDLYPGESWESESEEFQRVWSNRERLRDSDYIYNYAKNKFNKEEFGKYHPERGNLEREKVKEYLLKLNKVPEVKFCSNISVSLNWVNEESEDENVVKFKIEDGEVEIAENSTDVDLQIKIPNSILKSIIEENLSWDEAHIGYWCELHRSPDEYHFDFWRLLQAPYYQKSPDISDRNGEDLSMDRSISDVIEEYGSTADRILRRYGLYCIGCQHSPQETIRDGAHAHGLSEEKTQRLIEELNQILHGR